MGWGRAASFRIRFSFLFLNCPSGAMRGRISFSICLRPLIAAEVGEASFSRRASPAQITGCCKAGSKQNFLLAKITFREVAEVALKKWKFCFGRSLQSFNVLMQ